MSSSLRRRKDKTSIDVEMGEEQPIPFHVGIESSFSTARAGARHQRSSSFNSLGRPKSRERTAAAPSVSTQNVLISKSVTATEQGVNRWSRSTSSSAASNTHKRSSSFTRRMSFGGGAFLDTTPSPPRKLQKSRPSTGTSPSQPRITRTTFDPSLISLPPINTLPSLQTSVGSSSSPLTGATTPSPSTAQILSAAARSVDYFGRAWEDSTLGPKDFSQKRSASVTRSATLGPSPVLGPNYSQDSRASKQAVEEERPRSRGHSRHRSQVAKGSSGTGSSNRSSKQPSQKAMLSKALQKANTAVLLDNAQNFEGAMQAYSEACTLLQQVMLRSSGDEDRRKLEAIVSGSFAIVIARLIE